MAIYSFGFDGYMAKHGIPISPLLAAVRAGNLDQVVAALDNGAAVDEQDIHGHPGLPLRTACFEGHLAIIEELIRRGADVNASAADGPGMPIRLAARAGQQAVVQLLLEHGAHLPAGLGLANPSPPPPPKTAPVASPWPDEKPVSMAPVGNLIPAIEEVELTACYGVDTNVLDMDLLRLDEASAPLPAAAVASQKGFWKSRSGG